MNTKEVYEDKHEALLMIKPWRPVNVGQKGIFPSVGISYDFKHRDGSGGGSHEMGSGCQLEIRSR